ADAPRQFLEWIVATADPRVSAKTLSTLGAEPTIYSGDARVRGPYTREGWITQVGPQIRALARITARDTVLRFAIGSAPSIEDSLETRYVSDFTLEWKGLVCGLGAGDPTALERLRAAIPEGRASPVITLLDSVRHQARLQGLGEVPARQLELDFAVIEDAFAALPGSTPGTAGGGFGCAPKRSAAPRIWSDQSLARVKAARDAFGEHSHELTPTEIAAVLTSKQPTDLEYLVRQPRDENRTSPLAEATYKVPLLPME